MATASQIPKVSLADANGDVYSAAGVTGGLTNAELRASSVPVDTELAAAFTPNDAVANPTVPGVINFLLAWDGDNGVWRRVMTAKSIPDASTGIQIHANAQMAAVTATTWDRLRTPKVFKPITSTAIGAEATIWTPAAGKKFRLMGGTMSVSAAASVTLKDNTAGTTIFITPTLEANVPYSLPNLGNGIISAAANNVLTATSSAAANVVGTVWGTEE